MDDYLYLESQLDVGHSHCYTAHHNDLDRERRDRKSSERHSSRRSRSRSRSRHRHSRRSRSRERYTRRREPTPPEMRLARERERELKELERATRTVFATNINLKADERDLFTFFSRAGKVLDIKLITDKNTKRSKGLAYIEFARTEDVMASLSLTGQQLMGQTIMVRASEAEKNLQWEAEQQSKQVQQQLLAAMNGGKASTAASLAAPGLLGAPAIASLPAAAGCCQIQASNLHPDLSSDDVRQLFEPFGRLGDCVLTRDANPRAPCTALITYLGAEDAACALTHWNGRELAGLSVAVTVPLAVVPPLTPSLPFPSLALPGALPLDPLGLGLGSLGNPLAVSAAAASAGPVVVPGELLEGGSEDSNVKLNAQARAALMSKLASSAGLAAPSSVVLPAPAAPAAPAVDPVLLLQQGVLGPASPIPTLCLLLKGMFGAEDVTQPGLVEDLQQDVKDECARFGTILHVHVDPHSQGMVYLKYDCTLSAQSAHTALNGRFYSGRQILVEYQFLQVYNAHFKLA